MANVMDYIRWRGDLSFAQDPPNEVDALVFSTISYDKFTGSVEAHPNIPVKLKDAAAEFLSLPDCLQRTRAQNDLDMLSLAAASRRFGEVELLEYRQKFIKERDTQFGAVTFRLDDRSLFLSFRGTDNTLVGWKEDFSMCFRETIPSQRLAQQYARDILMEYSGPARISGHSKGGNLAVYAASKISPALQKRILEVYNQDGPGFSEPMLEDPGYLAILPKIRTYVPQSSVIGMIMYRQEPITIVKSTQIGIMQHDSFSWELMGKAFVTMDALTGDARFLQLMIENWLAGMDHESKVRMVNMLFELLSSGDVELAPDIFLPRNMKNYIRAIRDSEVTRRYLTEDLTGLYRAAKKARLQMEEITESLRPEDTGNHEYLH